MNLSYMLVTRMPLGVRSFHGTAVSIARMMVAGMVSSCLDDILPLSNYVP